MKISKQRLAEIVKEEFQLEEGMGARHQERMMEKLEGIKRGLTAVLEIVDDPAEVTSQLTREIGDLNQWQMQLKRYFYEVGDHTMEEGEEKPTFAGHEDQFMEKVKQLIAADEMKVEIGDDFEETMIHFIQQDRTPQEAADRYIGLHDEGPAGYSSFNESTPEKYKMKISKQRLAEIIKEEYNASLEEERGEPGEQPPYPSVKQDPAEVEKIADLMANDPEFEMFRQHVEKFKKYAQSGGSAVSSLESALPEYMPGHLIQKLIDKVRPPGPKTPMGMPDLAGVEGDYDDPADKKKGGGYDFSKRFARTLAKEK